MDRSRALRSRRPRRPRFPHTRTPDDRHRQSRQSRARNERRQRAGQLRQLTLRFRNDHEEEQLPSAAHENYNDDDHQGESPEDFAQRIADNLASPQQPHDFLADTNNNNNNDDDNDNAVANYHLERFGNEIERNAQLTTRNGSGSDLSDYSQRYSDAHNMQRWEGQTRDDDPWVFRDGSLSRAVPNRTGVDECQFDLSVTPRTLTTVHDDLLGLVDTAHAFPYQEGPLHYDSTISGHMDEEAPEDQN